MDADLQRAAQAVTLGDGLAGPRVDALIHTWRRAGRPQLDRVKDRLRIAKSWAQVFRHMPETNMAASHLAPVLRFPAHCFGHSNLTGSSKPFREIKSPDGLPSGLIAVSSYADLPPEGVFYSFYAWPSFTGGWLHPFLFCRACAFRQALLNVLTGRGLP